MESIPGSFLRSASVLPAITIPASVKEIGALAFGSCNKVLEVRCEGSVPAKWLNVNAFQNTIYTNGTLYIPEGSKDAYLADANWARFKNMEEYEAPFTGEIKVGDLYYSVANGDASVIASPESEEGNYASLTSVTIPETIMAGKNEIPVVRIATKAFFGAPLTAVTTGKNLVAVGDSAFMNCSSLASYQLPEVTSMGISVFQSCKALTQGVVPPKMTEIPDRTFSTCTGIKEVIFNSENISRIGKYAFSNCTGMPSIEVPATVNEIGDAAFTMCSSMTSAKLPVGLSTVGKDLFYYCSNLSSVNLPDSMTVIAQGMFRNTALTDLPMHPGVTAIEKQAFSNCTKLKAINIPEGIRELGVSAFYFCTGAETVSFPSTLTKVENTCFQSCTGLIEANLPNSVTSWGTGVFQSCTKLMKVTLPSNMDTIPNNFLRSASALPEITIPESVKVIGTYAFGSCNKLLSVTCESSVPALWAAVNSFQNTIYTTGVLHIPEGSKDAYMRDTYWSRFKNIEEDYKTGIEDINAEDSPEILVIYGIDGKIRPTLEPGINIVRLSDGRIVKHIIPSNR